MCAFIHAVYIPYKRKYWQDHSQLKYFGELNIDNLYLIHKSNCTEELILMCACQHCVDDYLLF